MNSQTCKCWRFLWFGQENWWKALPGPEEAGGLGSGREGRKVKAVCWEEHRAPAVEV